MPIDSQIKIKEIEKVAKNLAYDRQIEITDFNF